MKKLWIVPVVAIVWLLGFTGQKDTYADPMPVTLLAQLDGFHQIPPVHTEATGTFSGRINEDGTISYTLTYSGLTQPIHVRFADIHFGPAQNTGGILVFLCSNTTTAPTQANPVSVPVTGTDINGVSQSGNVTFNGPVAVPPGTQTCPDSGTVTGTIRPDAVVEAGKVQGIAAGELAKVVEAIRSGQTYVQIHTERFPGGELRRQIRVQAENDQAEDN